METKNGYELELSSKLIQTDMVTVSVATARKWLTTQVRNRQVQVHSMLSYREDMKAGRWTFDAMPIRFDRDGQLIDGQNRLTALSGLEPEDFALVFMVVRGLDADTQLVMDQGARRTAGQQLGLTGQANGNVVAAGTRMYLNWTRGNLFSPRWGAAPMVTNAEIISWVKNNPILSELASSHVHRVRQIGMRPSVGLGFAIRMGSGLKDEVTEFYREMDDMSNLPSDSPTLTFSKRLNRVRTDAGLKLSDIDQLGFLVRTWNNWVNGRPASRLQRPTGGWNEENFPHPDGV